MRCAKCESEMTAIVVEKVEVDRCDSCGGIWFDRLELAKILDSGESHLLDEQGGVSSADDKVPGTCPRCTVGLTRYESRVVDGMGYDHCGSCHGVWLDKGELATLSADPEAGHFVAFAADIAHRAMARGSS